MPEIFPVTREILSIIEEKMWKFVKFLFPVFFFQREHTYMKIYLSTKWKHKMTNLTKIEFLYKPCESITPKIVHVGSYNRRKNK